MLLNFLRCTAQFRVSLLCPHINILPFIYSENSLHLLINVVATYLMYGLPNTVRQ